MLSLSDLSQAVDAYRNGDVSLGEFEDWFRTASRSMFGESKDVLKACLSIEAVFSELRYGGMSKRDFAQELANSIRPFVQETGSVEVVIRLVFRMAADEPETSNTARLLKLCAVAA